MTTRAKILVSACLLGEPVRYDGQSKSLFNTALDALIKQGRVVSFCPEVAGGLPTPRPAAEITIKEGELRITSTTGEDFTTVFHKGAKKALNRCQQLGITIAILTERSPSCGSNEIYDGSFSRKLIDGQGITTALLRQHGIAVFNQNQIDEAIVSLNN